METDACSGSCTLGYTYGQFPKHAEEQMKKVKSIEKWIKGYEQVRRLADELQLAFDYHKEELVTEEEVDAEKRE